MARAVWRGKILAESEKTHVVEGNVYFPFDSLDFQYFEESPAHTRCIWKGKASYYDILVDGQRNTAAAWYYPAPWPLARKLKDHVAFWKEVEVEA